jgi:amidophosphoribosyltransferase
MSGIFGVVGEDDKACIEKVFYGTDYHSHLGTEYGGMAYFDGKEIQSDVKSILLHPFRPQFSRFIRNVRTNMAIGVIGDYEPQPLDIKSRLGNYAIVHVGKINNLDELVEESYKRGVHFSAEKIDGKPSPIEVIADLINQGKNYVDGVEIMQNSINGSSSIMLLTPEGIIVARDKIGTTPIVVKQKDGATAATLETCAFPNTGFGLEGYNYLGPGEIGIITKKGYEQLKKPGVVLKICDFLYIYYGNPASCYEGINSEVTRYKFGRLLAEADEEDLERGILKVDFVTGIPDSGIGSGLGYSHASGLPFMRPYIKYTNTWQRSFMPRKQETRDLFAKMKLIPVRELIYLMSILSTEDSIVRATQLKKKIQELFDYGAREVHMRPSCPPLIFTCTKLNFSRSKDLFDLAARRAMREVEGKKEFDISPYLDENSEKYLKMIDFIRGDLGLTSLKYPKYSGKGMVSAIGLPEEKLCGGCWKECISCK